MSKKTNEILTHHLTAFGDNNLDETMKDYTEQSEVLTVDGSVKGLDLIRKFFAKMFITIPTGSEFEMKQLTIRGNVAHIVWASKSNVAEIPLGSDTFVLENDKIRFHTVVAYISNK
ncbi:MAG TPA: nuclear transport factor 2 family protein [Prolixibacteraceae bacterium]|nr:nuclear transport factor 2 family protein [Prolixibacteraceae bacterium]